MLLQAVLGLTIDASKATVTLDRPCLPPSLSLLELRGISCGSASVDLRLIRHAEDVGVEVIGRRGNVVVTAIK
jgi:hypothetical protein